MRKEVVKMFNADFIFIAQYSKWIVNLKPNRKKRKDTFVKYRQSLINPALEVTIKKEVDKMFDVDFIFLVQYSEWIVNLKHNLKKRKDIRLGC